MVLGIEGITSKVIEFALDGLSLRHDAIATNIANVNTQGYRPVQVSFEDKLAELVANKDVGKFSSFNSFITSQMSFGTPDPMLSSQTRIDMNTVMLNQNVLQYQALIKGLEKYESSIALATNDGRR